MMKHSLSAVLVLMLLLTLSGCVPALLVGGGAAMNQVPGFEKLKTLVAPNNSATDSKESPIEVVGIESEVPELLNRLAAGRKVDMEDALEDALDDGDAALALVERGRLWQLQSQFDESSKEFVGAVEKIREVEERATVSAGKIGANIAAVVVNDTMLPYELTGFERVMVYHFQALNHLMKGDVEAAGVEVRRANSEQARALKAHEEELVRIEKEAKEKGFSAAAFKPKVKELLGSSKDVANLAKNSFQNAYTFYASGVIREVMGEPNDAYIDYKKALEINPTNKTIQSDVIRLAHALNMNEDLARFKERFGDALKGASGKGAGDVDVVVLFEDGTIPEKQPLSFPLPIPIPKAPGVTAVAIPVYQVANQTPESLRITSGGGALAATERIAALDALAVRAYEENAPAMITRQVLRAVLKGAASSLASSENSTFGAVVGAINLATETADTRSWRSLPLNAQVARFSVSSGTELRLEHPSASGVETLLVQKGQTSRLLVRVTRVGSRLIVSHIEL